MCDTCGCKRAEDITLRKYPVKVVSYSVNVHKDDYEQGEIGDAVHYWRVDEDDLDFDTKAENEEELLQILNYLIRYEIRGKVPKHGKDNFGFEISNNFIYKAYTDVHATYEEGQGMGLYTYPTEYQKEAWKRGEQELYSLGFTFDIEDVDDFYAERFDAPQATIDTQWAMKMIQSQYDNVGIDKVLSIREDFEGDLFITILLTNGNRQQLIIEKSQIGMIYDEDKGEYVRMGAEEQTMYRLTLDDWPLRVHVDGCPLAKKGGWDKTYTADEVAQESYIILYEHESLPQFEGNTFGDLRKASSGLIVPCNCTINEMKVLKELDPATFTREPDETQEHWGAEGFSAENLSFKERVEKMIDVASPKFEGIKGLGKRIGAKQGKKLDYKIQGILPKAKGVSSYRRNIETPKWYKGIQLGLMTGLAGFITYKLATDNSKEE